MTKQNLATIASDVACSAVDTCFCPVGENGAGTKILYTTDGGQTFQAEPSVGELMYLGGAACGEAAVMSTPLWFEYNQAWQNNTFNFVNAACPGGFQSQNVECLDSDTFFGTGVSLAAGNQPGGVAMSTNGGANFSYIAAPVLLTPARYGAFPSATTWYIAAGQWANAKIAQQDAELEARGIQVRRRSARIATVQDGKTVKNLVNQPLTSSASDGCYTAQIVKTTDAGKSASQHALPSLSLS